MGKSSAKNVTTMPVKADVDYKAVVEELQEQIDKAYKSKDEKMSELIEATSHRINDCIDLFDTGKALVDAANGLRVFKGSAAEITIEQAKLVCMKVGNALQELKDDWVLLVNEKVSLFVVDDLDGWLDAYVTYDLSEYETPMDAVAGHLIQESVQSIWQAMARILEFDQATKPEFEKMQKQLDEAREKAGLLTEPESQ